MSLRLRVALLLASGTSVAGILTLLVAGHDQEQALDRFQRAALVASTLDLSARFTASPTLTAMLLRQGRIPGARPLDDELTVSPRDPTIEADLDGARHRGRKLIVRTLPTSRCHPPVLRTASVVAPALAELPSETCWSLVVADNNGVTRLFMIVLPRYAPPSPWRLSADFGMIVMLTSLGLTFITMRLVYVPLKTLLQAAASFSLSPSMDPLPEAGPYEIRIAIATFNLMQRRIVDGMRQRTYMLTAINHDLRTPLTRLRLRLDEVNDVLLRRKLLADLVVMQQLVDAGLELARSAEHQEAWAFVDIDSLLSSVAEDSGELDRDVRMVGGCGGFIRTKPTALVRCLQNLLDNAIIYGGRPVDLFCRRQAGSIVIDIRDHGPGIAEEMIERMFEPFVRGDASEMQRAQGTGIGLSIARALARSVGGSVTLSNHRDGGLVARVTIDDQAAA